MKHPELYYHEFRLSVSRVIHELLTLSSFARSANYEEFSDFALDTLKRFKDVVENSDYKEFFENEPIFKFLGRDEK